MAWRPIEAGDPLTHDMAVHAILVPGEAEGRILYFGGYNVYDTHLYSVADHDNFKTYSEAESPQRLSSNPHEFSTQQYDLFCCGHAFLPDGRVLCAGGELNRNTRTKERGMVDAEAEADLHHQHGGMAYGGERQCALYHPLSDKWEMARSMHLDPAGNEFSGGRWYPTLTTLPSGEILAVGGHPDRNEDYRRDGDRRHNNNTPERYNAGADNWTMLASDPPDNDQITGPFGVMAGWDYQRNHVLPDGTVFFTSDVLGANRVYDPRIGRFLSGSDKVIELAADTRYHGVSARYTSVMLPLLPGDGYRPRFLLFGGRRSYRIDLSVSEPSWQLTPPRDGWSDSDDDEVAHDAAPERHWVVPVLLPTGEVFLTGGTTGGGTDAEATANGVRRAEFYDPGIDWGTGSYAAGLGSWTTQSVADQASVPRQYHAVALLMPNGNVWAAGSNGTVNDPGGEEERRIELYLPWYSEGSAQANRPEVSGTPRNTSYGQAIDMEVRFFAGADIARVVALRAGSCTHGFNPDQRLIVLNHDVQQVIGGVTHMRAWAPPHSAIAPPGYYLIFAIDTAGRPSKVAPFVRISQQKCYVTEDISTYSIHEVTALGTPAVFDDACYVVFDGFLPDEVIEPSIDFLTLDGEPVEGIVHGLGAVGYETSAQERDVAQRIAYPIHITFQSMAAFDLIAGGEDFVDINLRARMRHAACEARLTLSLQPNPRMRDGHPQWLSTDVRVFRMTAGESAAFSAGLSHPPESNSAPFDFITALVNAYNGWEASPGDPHHPFDSIPDDQASNMLALYGEEADGSRIYNYAVARVRYVAPEGIDAAGVSLFFRLWTTGWTALTYSNPVGGSGSYRRQGNGAAARPLLGTEGGEINTVPCFAAPRAADMLDQSDPLNWNRTISGTGSEVHAYFGALLDNNDDTPRFPDEPGTATSFGGSDLKSIKQHTFGPHQCLVAEIHYPPDPIPHGSTPGSTDDLAQRNILFDEAPNPGSLASRIVHHTLEIKPSPHALPLDATPDAVASSTFARRRHPDELAIDWGNLPPDSIVTLYVPQWETSDVLAYAVQRSLPRHKLRRGGTQTLHLDPRGVTYVPVPGPSVTNIAALLSVQLPPSITKGERYSIVIRQIDGRRTRIVGTTQFDILVKTAETVLPRLLRKFSVLKYIAESIPPGNRWEPVFERYLGEMGDRVRALGVDPDTVAPDPAGNGGKTRPDDDKDGDDGHSEDERICIEGKVRELQYDCCGHFQSFTLADCDRTYCIDADKCELDQLLLTAHTHKMTVRVWLKAEHENNACANATCPVSGRPVNKAATFVYRGRVVGFCSAEHRDRFAGAVCKLSADIARVAKRSGRDTVNAHCPVSGKPVDEDASGLYRGHRVGFCSVAHRDTFLDAVRRLDDEILAAPAGRPRLTVEKVTLLAVH